MNEAPASPSPRRSPGALFSAVVILAGFGLFAAVVAWILHLSGPIEDVEAKRAIERVEFLHKARARDIEAMNSYGWADQTAGLVRIPVQRAAELAVERLKAKPVRAADLVPPPPPAPTAPAAAAPGSPVPSTPATPPPAPATPAPKSK